MKTTSGPHRNSDRGGATIMIVMSVMIMLLGAGFGIDIGQYVVASRSAQNTSDATALAVATDCALTGSFGPDYSIYAKPGQVVSAPYCGDGVTTATTTREVDGRLLSVTAGSVDRSAEARWGALGSANVMPIVISDCEFSQALLAGDADVVFYLDDTKPQSGCSSLPGGFSRLDGSGCEVPISAGGTVPGQPGGALNQIVGCIGSLPATFLIPMYDAAACQAAGCTGQGPYPILGFAALELTGYSFNGNNYAGTLGKKCPDDKDRGKYCIRGDFIEYTTTTGGPGGGDFGASVVYLSK